MRYLAQLSSSRIALWCYLLWYLFFAARCFDPALALWLTSLGIAGIVGVALYISTSSAQTRLGRWQVIRLFLMPFCVSSFSALVKGKGFILIFSPRWGEDLAAAGVCAAFCLAALGARFALLPAGSAPYVAAIRCSRPFSVISAARRWKACTRAASRKKRYAPGAGISRPTPPGA